MSIGPSTSQSPYLVSVNPNIRFESILSAGDAVGTKADGVTPWVFAGAPDGLGAFDNGDGTFTVLVSHEIQAPAAATVREHGAAGAFVSELVIDKASLAVLSARDLANTMYTDANGDGVYVQEARALIRLCSADLADVDAFFYAGADGVAGTDDDLGTQDRIFLTGEETGPPFTPVSGSAWAFVVNGDEARTVWELPALGKFSWENAVASPNTGAKTVVIGTDDATPGQVYVYVGDKQADGTTIEKAGLTGGILYGIKADGIGPQLTAAIPASPPFPAVPATGTSENLLTPATTPMTGSFSLVAIPDANTLTGSQLEAASDAAGITEWFRPEDSCWDTIDPNRLYFVTTSSFTTPSRLWALDFVDVNDPTLGGTFTMLLDGTEGQRMMDNLTVDASGLVHIQEDIGNNPAVGRVLVYNPQTDALSVEATFDPVRFGPIVTPPFNQDEESSGIIDVTALLGDEDTHAYLLDAQAHYAFPGPLANEVVEGGQLLVMYVDDFVSNPIGTKFDDTLVSGVDSEEMIGKLGNDLLFGYAGADSIRGGLGNDTLVGGNGADLLNGNDGADWFVYNNVTEGSDTIKRFQVGADKIIVSASGFGGGLVEGVLDSEKLAFGTEAELVGSGQFVFDDATGLLSWDANGQGGQQSVALATILFQPSNAGIFTAADILVIA